MDPNQPKRNHYYPKCLTKLWSKDDTVFVTQQYLTGVKQKQPASIRSVLFKLRAYTPATESYTARDDELFKNALIQLGKLLAGDDIQSAGYILTHSRQLFYKLLLRQPSLNTSIIKSTLSELRKCPYLMCSKNNPFVTPSEHEQENFVKWVNQKLFMTTPTNDDIDVFCYQLVVNNSAIPFILPDDTKPSRLILSVSPWLLMKYSFKSNLADYVERVPDATITFYNDDSIINDLNKALKDNCDKYYITAE